jgi:hypothetical protein
MSRWTLRRLPKKPQHAPHRHTFKGVLVSATWPGGKVECGKLFSKNGRSVIRIHNRNVIYAEQELREHANVEVR